MNRPSEETPLDLPRKPAHGHPTSGSVAMTCEYCGRAFPVAPRKAVREGPPFYCSERCEELGGNYPRR